jgi:hypothetical protein
VLLLVAGGCGSSSTRPSSSAAPTSLSNTASSSSFATREAEAQTLCAAYHPAGGHQARLEFGQPFTAGEVAMALERIGRSSTPWNGLPSGDFAARCNYVLPPEGPTTTATCDGGLGIATPAGIVEYFVDQRGDASPATAPGTPPAVSCRPKS